MPSTVLNKNLIIDYKKSYLYYPSPDSGPSLALCLAREDAVQHWRDMLGPKEVDVAVAEAPERSTS